MKAGRSRKQRPVVSNYLIIIYILAKNRAYRFSEVDNLLAMNNMPAPKIAAINAINPKNSTSANNRPGPCCTRSSKEKIDAPPEIRATRSRRPPTIHSPIDMILFMITSPTYTASSKVALGGHLSLVWFSRKLSAMPDSHNPDCLFFYTVKEPVRGHDNFSKGKVRKFRQRPAGLGELSEPG
jgi:hypothetical protein